MGEYKIDSGLYKGIFAAPNIIIDQYLKLASGNSLKVLLVVLRFSGEMIETKKIAEISGLDIHDVNDALKFWIDLELLEEGISSASIVNNVLTSDESVSGIIIAPASEIPAEVAEIAADSPAKSRGVTIVSSQVARPSQEEAAGRIAKSDSLQFLVSESGRILGRDLYGDALSSLVMLYETEEVGVDTILMLVHHSKMEGNSSWLQIENQVLHCKKHGIQTHEEVEGYIQSKSREKQRENKVKRIFGIGRRNLSTEEADFVKSWFNKFAASEEMIEYAYDLCVKNTKDFSFPYINTVLASWHSKGIKTAEEARELSPKGKKSKGKRQETSYDIDEMENDLLYHTPKI